MLTMEEALKHSQLRFAPGEIVKGTIIEVRPKEVLVDIGYKSEGVISGLEFEDIKAVKVGDEVDVSSRSSKTGRHGRPLQGAAEFKQNWEKILTICNEGGTHHRQGQGRGQGRPARQHRRRGLPARVPGRHHPAEEPQITSATPTSSRSSRSTRSARTSFSPAASSSSRNAPSAARSCWPR
jgi:hypothetical protein